MSVGTAGAIALGVGSMAGGIASGAIGANAAGNAASTQAGAAEQAAQLQYQAEQNSLQFQQQIWQQQQANAAPWLQSGAGATSTLDRLMGLNAPNIPANFGQPMPLSALNGQSQPSGTYAPGKPTFSGPGAVQANSPGGGFGPLAPGGSGSAPPTQFTSGTAPGGGFQLPPGSIQSVGAGGALQAGPGNPGAPPVGDQPGGNPWAGIQSVGAGGALQANPAGQMNPGQTGVRGVSGMQPNPSTGPGGVAPGITSGQLSPFTSWNQPFVAPTAATEQNDPGYQFRLQQGEKALQNSAAAQGSLLTGNTAAGINAYGQDYASNEYGNVYNRALGQYQQNYNIFQQNQANQFNRLASLAGMGQTAVGQLNSAGSSAGSNIGNTFMQGGQQIGQDLQNAGAATASGYVGGANAINGGISAGIGGLQQMMLLNQLQQNGGNGLGAEYGAQDGR